MNGYTGNGSNHIVQAFDMLHIDSCIYIYSGAQKLLDILVPFL